MDNGDGTISDTATGLMWEKMSADVSIHSIHSINNAYNWDDAFGVKIAGLNSGMFAGHNDWRLPNRFELETLINFGTRYPGVSPAFNAGCTMGCTVLTCSCTQEGDYWSSTSVHGAENTAWLVGGSDGLILSDLKTVGGSYLVRAVRGGN